MSWKKFITVTLGPLTLVAASGLIFTVARDLTGANNASALDSQASSSGPIHVFQIEYRRSGSVAESAENADVVLIGKVASRGGVVNIAFDPDDPYKQLTDIFGVGRLYHIEVEEYLKGSGPSAVTVSQFENLLNLRKESGEIRQNPALKAPAPGVNVMEPGSRYLFFLRRSVKEERTELLPGIEPYRYALDGDKAIPEGAHQESSNILPVRNAAELLSETREIVAR